MSPKANHLSSPRANHLLGPKANHLVGVVSVLRACGARASRVPADERFDERFLVSEELGMPSPARRAVWVRPACDDHPMTKAAPRSTAEKAARTALPPIVARPGAAERASSANRQ